MESTYSQVQRLLATLLSHELITNYDIKLYKDNPNDVINAVVNINNELSINLLEAYWYCTGMLDALNKLSK